MKITSLLIKNGIDLNAPDIYGAIPLSYAISTNKLSTKDNKEMYLLLIRSGSKYNYKDKFDKSCLDYAREFSWRNDFLDIVKEYENANK